MRDIHGVTRQHVVESIKMCGVWWSISRCRRVHQGRVHTVTHCILDKSMQCVTHLSSMPCVTHGILVESVTHCTPSCTPSF